MSRFKLVNTYRFTWPVKVETPDPEQPGKFVSSTFKVEMEAYGSSKVTEIEEEIAAQKLGGVAAETAFLQRVIKGWKEVEDADGNELPFNEENLSAALEHTFVRGAVYRAYFAAINGRAAELGN